MEKEKLWLTKRKRRALRRTGDDGCSYLEETTTQCLPIPSSSYALPSPGGTSSLPTPRCRYFLTGAVNGYVEPVAEPSEGLWRYTRPFRENLLIAASRGEFLPGKVETRTGLVSVFEAGG